MIPPALTLSRLCRHIGVRPRLFTSVLVGLLLAAVLPSALKPSTRALVAWLGGVSLYLVLAWSMMWHASVTHMKSRARLEDEGATTILLLTVAAAIASLLAIAVELHDLKALTPARQDLHVALVAATFAASWLLAHTAFALHYAHEYYMMLERGSDPPLAFPGPPPPVYTDFLYFSLVIGMTSQTADIGLAAAAMRRLVMMHGLVAFVFNTTLLALTINIVAGVLG